MKEETITRTDDKGILQFGTKKIVTKIGNSGHILLPVGLVGKVVEVYYLREKTPKLAKNKKRGGKSKKASSPLLSK